MINRVCNPNEGIDEQSLSSEISSDKHIVFQESRYVPDLVYTVCCCVVLVFGLVSNTASATLLGEDFAVFLRSTPELQGFPK